MTLRAWQFRLLLLLVWGALVADIAAPGHLKFRFPVVGPVDLRSLHSVR